MSRIIRTWILVLTPTVIYNLLLAVLSPFAFGPAVPADPRSRTTVFLGLILMAELTVLGLLLGWLRVAGRALADLGWGRPTTRLATVAAIGVALIYSALTLSSPLFGRYAAELSLFKVWGALVGVVGGVVEELVFRGFVITELKEAGLPPVAQAVASALLFSLIHGGYALLRGQLALLPGLGFTFVLGLVLVWLYLAGRQSLTGPVLAHGLINLLIEPWLMLGFVTFRVS